MSKKTTKKKLAQKHVSNIVQRAAKHVRHRTVRHVRRTHAWYTRRSFWQKVIVWIVLVVFMWISSMYAIARWYIASNNNKAVDVGVTFIARYARSFGLNPQETMQAMIDELGIRNFRLVSYWDEHEKKQGTYDFSDLDWQFKKAEKYNAKVSLAIGLRQPRWPECHMPEWAKKMPKNQWNKHLKDYMRAVIERYKDSPALKNYQLENEYFMKVFGICPDHSRERLIDEYNFVKQLDPHHPVIVSRSNNAIGVAIGKPQPDIFGISIYKRVWDKTITKRYVEYPFPAWYYAYLAGLQKIITGKETVIHELQAEPWPPTSILEASLDEQDKSMDAKRLRDRFEYGRATGMKEIYLWGAEWWYWRKVTHYDNSIWNVAREEIQRLSTSSNNCGQAYQDPNSRPPC